MKKILTLFILFSTINLKAQTFNLKAQTFESKSPTLNVRLSFLVFPAFSPLLTLETRTFQNLTLQLETNFINTYGLNIKYFLDKRMNGHYIFIGNALLESENLRKDKKITFLPYAGYGYSYLFSKNWLFDNRIGIGSTTNADKNMFSPVIKTGIGRVF
jgi:hypothetical protein